jgi:hypothetical protein
MLTEEMAMDREQALTELLEREQIRELATRYSVAADSQDFDSLVELFDPEVDNGRFGKGRAATKAYYQRLLGSLEDGAVLHYVANHQIDFVDDTHAIGICYVRAFSGIEGRWIDVVALYVDDYVKRDGTWFFARRKPADLQRVTIEQPRSIGKVSLADAWAEHRQRQASLREG